MLRAEHAEALVARALGAGLVTAAQVAAAREHSGEGRLVTEALVEAGALDPAKLAELERTGAREDFARRSSARALPPEVAAAMANPERVVGDFVLIERIGRGAG